MFRRVALTLLALVPLAGCYYDPAYDGYYAARPYYGASYYGYYGQPYYYAPSYYSPYYYGGPSVSIGFASNWARRGWGRWGGWHHGGGWRGGGFHHR